LEHTLKPSYAVADPLNTLPCALSPHGSLKGSGSTNGLSKMIPLRVVAAIGIGDGWECGGI